MRSFQIVEDKIKETDFFLEKIEESTCGKEMFWGTRYYLSAFLSASRSTTFTLHAAMKGIPDFDKWYEQHQNKLRQDDLSRCFVETRNLSQKVGYYPLTGGRMFRDEKNQKQVKFFLTILILIMKLKAQFPKKMFYRLVASISYCCWNLFAIVLLNSET